MTEKDLKIGIQSSIKALGSREFSKSVLSLFSILGYKTDRQNPFPQKTFQFFKDSFLGANQSFNEDKALTKEWTSVDLLFQLSRAELTDQQGLFEIKRVDNTIIEAYLFFAIELSKADYSRTALAQITREVNKVFRMPVMVVFRHGNNVTISVTNRRMDKRDEQKDVLEKVTLIKDISIQNPHRAHIEILFDLSFEELKRVHQFTNFVELHNAWQKTLDTKELNKRFYRELSNWYFWAIHEVTFPVRAMEADKLREHNAKNLIRLLTRILFVWFIKEKNLIPDELFDERYIKDHLIDGFGPRKRRDLDQKSQGSKYYRAILQNLFFATLNQTVGKREFRKNGQQMNVTNLMRYESYFKDPKAFLKLVEDVVPFMNGGLFECLDTPDPVLKGRQGGDVIIYEDGFSDRKDNILYVPDYIFFGTGEHADLSEELGDKKQKDVTVSGLINILKSYKFTVTENTPVEEDIALDPELLGSVFENLLASYNPETKTTARKQTGSFYTPREIVNYMVDESIKAYLKQKLETEAGMTPEDAEAGLGLLIGYNEKDHLFDEKQTAVLINAIDTCKILDPACGSGAFPMGILHKLVHVLHKLDPQNSQWKERQIAKARAIEDISIRDQVIEDIETAFSNNELDYGRKLYLIENCIYGVDIQPIATQISKLRFFISLIVDQKSDKAKENFGIRPLPNLETKFVAANTLIGIEKPKSQISLFDNQALNKLEEKLKDVRHRLFSAKTPATKHRLREEDQNLREQMGKLLKESGWPAESASQLSGWDPYDQNASSPFFDPEWMFGIPDGFDAVIGNPPYIEFKKLPRAEKEKLTHFESTTGKYDLFVVFMERAIHIVKINGYICLIEPTTFMKKDFGGGIRKYIRDNCKVISISDFADIQVFDSVTNYTGIFIFKKKWCNDYFFIYHKFVNTNQKVDVENFNSCLGTKEDCSFKKVVMVNSTELQKDQWNFQERHIGLLIEKLGQGSIPLAKLCSDIFEGISSGKDEVFYISEDVVKSLEIEEGVVHKILRGKDISRYKLNWSGDYVIYPYDSNSRVHTENTMKRDFRNCYSYLQSRRNLLSGRDYFNKSNKIWFELWNQRDIRKFAQLRIVTPEISSKNSFMITNDFFGNTKTYHIIIKPDVLMHQNYVLGLLNSKLLDFIYKKIATPHAGGYYAYKTQFLSSIPIRKIQAGGQQSVVTRVERILDITKDANYLQDGSKQEQVKLLEREIDQLVYQIYDLTQNEIDIVDGSYVRGS